MISPTPLKNVLRIPQFRIFPSDTIGPNSAKMNWLLYWEKCESVAAGWGLVSRGRVELIGCQNGRSGMLNNKHREILELQKKAQARLAKTRERFQDGLRDAREVRDDLEWTEKKMK